MGSKQDKKNEFQDELNLRELLQKYTSKWKWFAVSLIITFGTVLAMLRYTPMSFESQTKLLIQYEKAGAYSELSAFKDLGLFEGVGGYNNLYNEQEVLHSRSLIGHVVRKLDLNIEYHLIGKKTGIERKEFYKTSPIIIDIVDKDSAKIERIAQFNVEVINGSSYRFIDTEGFDNKERRFNDTLESDLGKFVFRTTKYYLAKHGPLRINVLVRPIENTISIYQSRLHIEPINDNVDILKLSIRGPVIRKNNDFLDSLVTEHTQQTISDQLQIYRSTTSFINERIDAISDELSDVEADGEKYKTQYDFSDILMSEKSLYDRTLVNEKKLVASKIQLELMDYLFDYINTHPDNDELLPANLGFEDASISQSVAEFNKKALEKMRALENSSEKNPAVIKLENDLKSIKQSLKTSLLNSQASLNMEVNHLSSMESNLNANIADLPKHKRVLRSIERQQQVKESLYLYLLQKREENEIASAVTEGNSKIIDPAYSNGYPVSPNRKIYYALALFFGLVSPFSIIYLKGLLDNKVRGKDDLLKYDLTHLGNIPEVGKDQKIVISKGNNSPEAEAFRILRTNTSFILGSNTGQGKVIIATSTIAKEGKSFVALNLATSYALAGKKTIVVGLDLRAPKLLEYANVVGAQGVTDYILNDKLNLDDLIVPMPKTEQLFILPSGIKPPNPAEIILRKELNNLFDELKSKFDIIIVDTAPVGLVTDTLLIADLADAFIYVVRANYLEKKSLGVPDELVKEGKIKNVGLVINAVNKKASGNYGYGYGYGYIEEEQSNSRFRNPFRK